MWDVGGDNHETFDGAGIIQFADLSLMTQSLKP
jgi:hypothetical protein